MTEKKPFRIIWDAESIEEFYRRWKIDKERRLIRKTTTTCQYDENPQ